MFITITFIELKSPLKFFALSHNAMKIMRQLKDASCRAYKAQGFWTKHYTMTQWDSIEALKSFAKSGAHLEAIKKSAAISKEIRTLTIEASALPAWKDAKKRLFTEGKVLRF